MTLRMLADDSPWCSSLATVRELTGSPLDMKVWITSRKISLLRPVEDARRLWATIVLFARIASLGLIVAVSCRKTSHVPSPCQADR